jgi:biopolymer transport protein ExbB
MAQNNPAAKAAAQQQGGSSNLFSLLVVPIAIVIAILVFVFVLGNPGNFEGNDPSSHPINLLGTVHKGGVIVPILMSLSLIVIIFSIERFLTINRAKGNGNMDTFLKKVKFSLESGDVNAALADCDKQKGSLANVVKAGLHKYKEMEADTTLDKDSKVGAIAKEVEEATGLELPMLEKNLVFLATIASVATLMGLFGTVLGMIGAFSALATAGAPDSTALANGISEALINTALGIGTSAVAIIAYNYFTTQIDGMTYRIDEAGYSIAQTFGAKHSR